LQYNSLKCSAIPKSFDSVNRMRTVKIFETKEENFTTKTISFNDKLCEKAEPGQFVMVWIPGVDEIPISLSGINLDGLTSITVNGVGDASIALNKKNKGEIIGIRGPFGNGFVTSKGNLMIIGGGTGIGPLMPLAEKLAKIANKLTVISGAKSKENLLFIERINKICSEIDSEIICTTEDGSYKLSGFVTDYAEMKLKQENFDMIYTCGPEPMMYKLFLLAEQFKIPIQASLERIMRCSIGLCGSCQIGKLRVCKEGPVLTSKQLRSIKEDFGKFRLDATGKKIQQP
jgi:dihydroorotate dehydrogenase electron transfer subunit